MSKTFSLFFLLTIIQMNAFGRDESSDIDFLSEFSGLQSVQQEQASALFSGLESNGFFIWRWLFGDSKGRGGKSRVSPSQGLVRAPLAKPSRRNSNSMNPSQLAGSSPKPSGSSQNPSRLSKDKSTQPKTSSTNPTSLGSSSSTASSNSRSITSLSKGDRRPASQGVRFANQPRPPVSVSIRDEYFGRSHREFGLTVGSAHAFTSLSAGMETSSLLSYQMQNTGLAFGLFARFRMIEWFALGVSLDYAKVSGIDEDGFLLDQHPSLGGTLPYSFENRLMELAGRAEFYLPTGFRSPVDVYGFAGIAAVYNDPQWPDGFQHHVSINTLIPAIPIGLGVKGRILPKFDLGFELGYRYLAYEALDGFPGNTYDSYLFSQLKASYRLPSKRK